MPKPLGATEVSSSALTGANATNSLVVNTPGNIKTLTWTSDFSAATGFVNVTFNFNRPLSNFKVNLSNINISRKTATLLGTDYTDEVVVNGATPTPVIDILLTTIAGTATTAANVTTANATVQASFASPVTSLTFTFCNGTPSFTNPDEQIIGIDQMTWCRALPTAVDVTSAALLSSIGTASISPLASLADNVPVTYTLTSVPTAAQGVLPYNNGTAYVNIMAAG